MAQTTTNYGLLKPEATDSYNHLIYDNPNMDTIDAAMKANSDAAISSATCIKSGTTHTITRSNTSASVMRFTATGDWNSGDTMIIDGVTVSPYLMTGEALKTGAYLINSEVIIALVGTRATVLSNQSEAGTTYFDDTNVSFTANNVGAALEALNDSDNILYSSGISVKQKIQSILHKEDVAFTNVSIINGDGGYSIECPTVSNHTPLFALLITNTSSTAISVTNPLYNADNKFYVMLTSSYNQSRSISGRVTIYYANNDITNG